MTNRTHPGDALPLEVLATAADQLARGDYSTAAETAAVARAHAYTVGVRERAGELALWAHLLDGADVPAATRVSIAAAVASAQDSAATYGRQALAHALGELVAHLEQEDAS